MTDEFIHEPRIAYFSMEIALRNEIPTYAGGLGILAGDTMRSAADLGLPVVAVSLVSRAGYFRQEIDRQGRQDEHPDPWEPSRWAIESKGALDGDARSLYDKLQDVVLPLYYNEADGRSGWLRVMKGAISRNASYFNSHRMMRRYATEAYLR